MLRSKAGLLLGSVALAVCAIAGEARAQVAPGSPIVGIWNTTAGGDSTASTPGTGAAGQFPAGEAPGFAIDGNNATKYLNFGTGGGGGVSSTTKGVGTGFYVTPTNGPLTLKAVQVVTANDSPARDPLAITIEGSNATGTDLDLGSNWTLIYAGPVGLNTDPGRLTAGPVVSFANDAGYSSFRVLTTAQRASANSVQYAEMRLIVPEPGSIGLIAVASVGLLARRRR
jgi:hypothetical protein